MKLLALSIQDLRYPIHGNARLALSTLGALALKGLEVTYVNVAGRRFSSGKIDVASRYGEAHFKSVELMGTISRNPFAYLSSKDVLRELDETPEAILCEDRRLFLLCKALSTKHGIPEVLRLDSLRYLYHTDLIRASKNKLSDGLSMPPATASYVFYALGSDLAIAVSKYIERRFRALGLRNIHTVEPTFMLLNGSSDALNSETALVESLPDDSVLCSCPLEMTVFLASKTPELHYVVTGPSAFYVQRFLHGMKNKPGNLHFLWNVSDAILGELHRRVKLGVIARPVLTGVSMTLVQELYFGIPCVTDSNVAKSIEQLSESGSVVTEDDYAKWPEVVRRMMREEGELGAMSKAAMKFFNLHLSPIIHGRRLQGVMSTIL